ncbi:NADP-dependent malic enzyme-like [Asparagus officinalis]|uniref:NADP-dependent malic enzyme-like n=1 Tax=Asparagus officinalis TaxID=4686 RepID=UPI00098DF527|nr:NADP-dependent malic enzyme-like [Asparagus officinalis]
MYMLRSPIERMLVEELNEVTSIAHDTLRSTTEQGARNTSWNLRMVEEAILRLLIVLAVTMEELAHGGTKFLHFSEMTICAELVTSVSLKYSVMDEGMGIPVGKLSLYTALGGIRPNTCLPITIDVGTNNKQLLNDEFYIGLRHKLATCQEYAELLHEFMTAVKQNYEDKVLIQFEDFSNHNAFELLAKYSTSYLLFNDDIQGTASIVLAGLVPALNLVGEKLPEHTFWFLGAGKSGTEKLNLQD